MRTNRTTNPTKPTQARINQRNAEKKLLRLFRDNFENGDIMLHLSYTGRKAPADRETAQKDLYNFIRRLKRKYKANERDLKYISCTELGGNTGRVHHHLIISGGLDRDEIEKLWGSGRAQSGVFLAENEETNRFLECAGRAKTFFKRWNQSRNLDR